MTKKAVYTGSFNPITNGHMDIIIQALSFVEDLVIAVGCHSSKQKTFLSVQNRLELIMRSIDYLIPDHRKRVSVISFEGLAVNLAKDVSAQAIIRGLRDMTDFEYEMRMASINRHLLPEISTIVLFSGESFRYVSSTLVRHLISMGEDITSFTPYPVSAFLKDHYRKS
ncbi:MAG: pantetheine-phosphate adenylyltransferase [Candidatus Liberibacter europaeus]|uniref:Phosphopantetheine adenylyltransferase n=1 Tax=Candidatus Liberibacter europaeus TaxID=744859 RepID=A0A2T4VY67_9HYPH|nr:pantetheine-phosphate adenylyltransferase [Candidatus Liberibacter europaeus]PTL86714.1 MAG: pantetheine-phosphate adenylyltransferase [Candidatus Liberibacter europaeus]